VDLVRDILDARLVDQNGRNIGRVDGILLELRRATPPRVAALEVGASTLARRLHPRLARWFRALALRLSPVPLTPVRIPPHALRDVGDDIELDVDAADDRKLLRLEKWISRRIVSRLPGGSP